jgi:putative transcriptional regulator
MNSKILDAVHQTASGLHKSGTITDVTMREFDKLCLLPVHAMQPAEIKKLREAAKISQSVLRLI